MYDITLRHTREQLLLQNYIQTILKANYHSFCCFLFERNPLPELKCFYVVTLWRWHPRPREQLLLLNYNTQRHAVFFKDTLTIEDEKLFRPCRSVRSSVPQSHYKSGTRTQSVKISTLYHNFLIHYSRDFFSYLSYMY